MNTLCKDLLVKRTVTLVLISGIVSNSLCLHSNANDLSTLESSAYSTSDMDASVEDDPEYTTDIDDSEESRSETSLEETSASDSSSSEASLDEQDQNSSATGDAAFDDSITEDENENAEYIVLLNAGDGAFEDDDNELLIYVYYDKPYGEYHRYLILTPDENEKTGYAISDGTPDDYTEIREYEELPEPSLDGYEFIGWNIQEKEGSDDEDYFVSSKDKVQIEQDHALYARWTKKDDEAEKGDAKDTKDADSEEESSENEDAEVDVAEDNTDEEKSVDNSIEEQTSESEILSEEQTSESEILSEENSSDNTEDETILESSLSYAESADDVYPSLRSASTYSVTFKLQGGDFPTTDSVVFTVSAGSTVERPEDPSRIKYDFKGWYTSEDGDIEYDFDRPIYNNTCIYAQWTAKYKADAPYAIVFRSRTDSSSGSDLGEDARISLSSSSYDVKIYYILNPDFDNEIPTDNDNLYTDVLVAGKIASSDGTITIRAIAVKDGYENSEVTTFVYHVIPESSNWGELTDEDRKLYDDPSQIPDGMWVAGITDKTYSGSAISFAQDEIRVYDGKKLLKSGTDYSVSYKNNTNVGTATVIVSGKNNYSGRLMKTFEIAPRDISGDSVQVSDIILQYTGDVQKAAISLYYYNGKKNVALKEGSDYTCTYPGTDPQKDDYDNKAFVGASGEDRQYIITITGTGNFAGTRTVTETIVSDTKVLISSASVSIPSAKISDRNEDGCVCPVPVLRYDGAALTGYTDEAFAGLSSSEQKNVDYTYHYIGNDQVGTAYIVFEGCNGYAGTVTSSFSIKGVSISSVRISGFVSSFTYNGREQKQDNVTLSYNKDLVEGEDYLVTYSEDTTNVGTVTVTYTGINGFAGTTKKSYKITAYNLSDDASASESNVVVSVTDKDGDNTFVYAKDGVTPLPVVTFNGVILELGRDYTLSYANNTSIDGSKKPSVTVKGKGNFAGSITSTFDIEKQSISASGLSLQIKDKAFVAGNGNYTTTFTVIDSNGKALSAGSDYDETVVYSYAENVTLFDGTIKEAGDVADSGDIVPAGTIMRITVTGTGYYEGQISAAYRIVSGDISKASVRVYTQYYTGDEVRPDKNQIEVKLDGTVLSPEDYEITSYADNVNKGTARLSIRGIGDYGGIKDVNFTIAARTMNYVIIFNGNGSTSGQVSTQTVSPDKTVSLSPNRYSRKNYVFTGWNTEADGSGISYENKQQITNDGSIQGVNLVLFAQWEPEIYSITYHLNGGCNNAANTRLTYTALDATITIYAPEREDWENGYQFGGWYSDSSYQKRMTEIKSGSSGDIDLYAKWIPYTYNVIFDGNGADSGKVSGETFSYGVAKTLNTNCFVKKDFVFMGWAISRADANNKKVSYLDEESVVDLISRRNNHNGQITLYAVWRDTFEISYYIDGGSFENTTFPRKYTYGEGVRVPDPVKKGYIFGGWYDDPNLKNRIYAITSSMHGDISLYAKWIPYTYTISFNGNGNDAGSVDSQEYTYGVAAPLYANEYTKKGFIFAGWNTVKNPTKDNPGISYADMELVDILPSGKDVTITLYAQWEETDYSIYYVLNGGSFDVGAGSYISRYKYDHEGGYDLPVPERKGFTFAGWYTDAELKTKITAISKSSAQDLTLYAAWDMTYTVIYDPCIQIGDTLTGTMSDQKIKYNSSTALKKNAYKSSEYVFMGWALSRDEAIKGTVTYKNAQKLLRPDESILSYDDATGSFTLRLYAVWRNVFSITYELNGGMFEKNVSPITQYTYSSNAAYNLESPVRDGYTFSGWYTDSSFKVKISSIAPGSSGNKLLYAKWKSMNYKVSYIADPPQGTKVTGRMGTQTLSYGTEKKLTKNAYKIAGYSFAGWSIRSSVDRTKDDLVLTDQQIVDRIFDRYTESVVLYAVWSMDTYSIIYNNVAGSDNSMNPYTYSVEDAFDLAQPQLLGNTFLGWYSDENFTTKVTSIQKGTTGNKVFYAKWAITQYTIRYDLNAGDDESALLDTRNAGYITSYRDKTESGYRLASATRKGYTFAGWFEEASCITPVYQIIASPYIDKILYAKWIPIDPEEGIVPGDYISLSDFGSYPDDGLDDSRALQSAINRASENASNGGVNTVYLSAGVYNITDIGNYDHGIEIKSNVNLVMDQDAVLKVAGMPYGDYAVFEIKLANNVSITGGRLEGERYEHSGSYGEWGHGIALHGSDHITISNMIISGNWGDGIYLGTQALRQSDGSQKYIGSTNVIISNCEIFDNRRNNISLTDADNITITGCYLHDAHGTAPQCCVYIEPNADSSDKVCEHILIKDTIMTAYQSKDDSDYMVFMTHYNPYDLTYVTARDVRFIRCELNGFFGNYSGLDVTFENTCFNGTVVNLKAN